MATQYPSPPLLVASHAPLIKARSERLHYMCNMRGITILMVIASHCYGLAWSGAATNWSLNDPLLSFISGATPVFVFISGFFFHHVFAGRFDYPGFMRKKAVALLPPYFFVTVALVFWERALHIDSFRFGRMHDPMTQVALAALTGTAGPAMWYMPFIFDVFLLSPLFLLFMRARTGTQLPILAGLLVLGLLVDRDSFNRFANLGHFAFFYVFGIFCSLHRTRFEALVRRPEMILGCVAVIVLLAIAQYDFGLAEGAHHAVPWSPQKFVYVRKLALILLMAGVLLHIADRPVPGLTCLAEWSFALFFVHQLALLALRPLAVTGWVPPGYVGLLVFATLATGMSVAFVWTAREVFGARSRLLIGV